MEPESDMQMLDVRPEPDFLAGHPSGAANVPLESLAARQHELPPPRDEPLVIFDVDPARSVLAEAFLREREYGVELAPVTLPLDESGPQRVRLWKPNPFLVEALALARPPRGARALEVACGSGRDAVWLALEGYRVEAVDVLPDALERAADLAQRSGVAVETIRHDLERDPTIPAEKYDLVTCFRFLWRDLFPAIRAALRPGGLVVYETFHERSRESGLPPRSPAHLLRDGELAAAFAGFEVLIARDAARLPDGRYVSSLLARKKS